MSRSAIIQQNVINAIEALPGLDSNVQGIAVPSDVWGMQSSKAVGVCMVNAKWDPREAELSYHGVKTATFEVTIMIRSLSERASTSGLYEPDESEDIADLIMGTATEGDGTGCGIRKVNIAAGVPLLGPAYLDMREKLTAISPGRAAGQGGPIATVLIFESTSLSL